VDFSAANSVASSPNTETSRSNRIKFVEEGGEKSKSEMPWNDFATWYMTDALQNPNPKERSAEMIAKRVMATNFASIHTSTFTATNIFLYVYLTTISLITIQSSDNLANSDNDPVTSTLGQIQRSLLLLFAKKSPLFWLQMATNGTKLQFLSWLELTVLSVSLCGFQFSSHTACIALSLIPKA